MASMLASVKTFTGLEDSEQSTWEAQCTLSKKTRMYGFVGCIGFGLLITLLSFMFWAKPVSFALLYTLGNIVSVMSTGFLIGPKRQLKLAFHKKRVIATVTFLAAMILTLVAVFVVRGCGVPALAPLAASWPLYVGSAGGVSPGRAGA
jgi:hypothetical protein